MTRIAKAHVIALGLAMVASGCATQNALQMEKASGSTEVVTVNPDFKVDSELGEAGRELFIRRGCIGCHTVGVGRAAGPDLFGVTERRPVDWLKGFLKNTGEYLDTDPVAQGLLKQYNNQRMPNIPMSQQEIDALIHSPPQQVHQQRNGRRGDEQQERGREKAHGSRSRAANAWRSGTPKGESVEITS